MSPDYIIIRHAKENLKKCSLHGFESDPRFRFFTYPKDLKILETLPYETYICLDIEGPSLGHKDLAIEVEKAPLLIIDATWRYAQKIAKMIPKIGQGMHCSLPKEWVTAYPREQTDCPCPERGLASIEAIYVAALLTNRDPSGLLDRYYWHEKFLDINKELII